MRLELFVLFSIRHRGIVAIISHRFTARDRCTVVGKRRAPVQNKVILIFFIFHFASPRFVRNRNRNMK